MIELKNFSKTYGDFVAVNDLSFKIEEGEMFGFIGPNGAGKSTTIRFLATLLKATAGEGIVNGYHVTRDPIGVRKSVGYMPDSFGVYDGMKVWEFLDFFAVAYQIPRSRRRRVRRAPRGERVHARFPAPPRRPRRVGENSAGAAWYRWPAERWRRSVTWSPRCVLHRRASVCAAPRGRRRLRGRRSEW